MSISCWTCRAAALIAAAGVVVSEVQTARAEPAAGKLMSGVRVSDGDACTLLRIEFQDRITYLSHFSATAGDELRIQVKPLTASAGGVRAVVVREALRPPSSARAGIHAIELEPTPQGAVLSLHFKRTTSWRVAPGADLQSIVVAVAPGTQTNVCEPRFPETPLAASQSSPPSSPSPAAAASEPVTSDPVQLLAQARSALARNDADKAVQLLTKLLQTNAPKETRQAKELLGLARERKGQIAHAKAEYREYLQLYPSDEAAERIKQRLAVMEAGDQQALAKLRADVKDIEPALGPTPQERAAAAQARDPNAWTVSQWGSVSATYNINQGKRDQFAAPLLQQGWNRDSTYQVYLNSLLSTLDYSADFEKGAFTGRFNFSASEQTSFTTNQSDAMRVASLYFDGRWRDLGAEARIGRQNLFGYGVLGRFDGVHTAYQVNDMFKLHAVAGAPVEWAFDSPFATGRFFYGVGADLPKLREGFDTSIYAIEQRDGTLIDRQAIGAEARFTSTGFTGHGAAEFDTYFGGLNSALATGTRIFEDTSSLSGTLDFRRSPSLFLANALMGQPYVKLSDMLKRYGSAELERLAWDRTGESYAATLAYSRPLTQKLQVNLDGTVLQLSGMAASGGVDATPPSGLDYYTSAQLVASDVLREGDSVSGAVRYAVTKYDTRYMVEFASRVPVSKDWRINPTLRLGYVDYATKPWTEYQVYPSIRTSYYVMKDVALELDVGNRWIVRDTQAGRQNETELLVLTGLRYDFRTGK